jgi:hypothetical protein
MIQIDQIVYLHKLTTHNYKGLKFLHQIVSSPGYLKFSPGSERVR